MVFLPPKMRPERKRWLLISGFLIDVFAVTSWGLYKLGNEI